MSGVVRTGPAIGGTPGVGGSAGKLNYAGQIVDGVTGTVLWDPSGAGDLTTWDDVQQMLANSRGSVEIEVLPGSVYVVPGNLGTIDFHTSFFSAPLSSAFADITVADGTVFRNIGAPTGTIVIDMHPTAAPSLVFDDPGIGNPIIVASFFGALYRNRGTYRSLIDIADNAFVVLAQEFGVIYDGAGRIGNAGFVHLGINAICILITAQINGQAPIGADQFSSTDGTAAIGVAHDGSIADFVQFPTQTNFLGAMVNLPSTRDGAAGPAAWQPVSGISALLDGTLYKNTTTATEQIWDVFSSSWLTVAAGASPGSAVSLLPLDFPLAALQAAGAVATFEFNAGSFGANTVLLRVELSVVQPIGGPGLVSASTTTRILGLAFGSHLAAVDASLGPALAAPPGSNPIANVSGDTLTITVTLVGGTTFDVLTDGHLTLNCYVCSP